MTPDATPRRQVRDRETGKWRDAKLSGRGSEASILDRARRHQKVITSMPTADAARRLGVSAGTVRAWLRELRGEANRDG
jgi:hypothetical protein